MQEGRRPSVIATVLILAGAIVLFCSWFFFLSVGSGNPYMGSSTVLFEWHIGLIGMVLVTIGLGLITYSSRRKSKMDRKAMPQFMSAAVFFILSVLITVVVFNPLISPYGFIRDSDLDGYTDDMDSFPHDKDRYMPVVLDIEVAWENTSTNYIARVSGVYVIFDGETTDTSVMRLVIRWLPDYYNVNSEDYGTLQSLDGTWTDGVRYQDNAPLGLFGLNDVFSFDTGVFNKAAEAHVVDDAGYGVTDFQITT